MRDNLDRFSDVDSVTPTTTSQDCVVCYSSADSDNTEGHSLSLTSENIFLARKRKRDRGSKLDPLLDVLVLVAQRGMSSAAAISQSA